MTRIKGQSEAARNARLDRACCPTHGQYMSQIAGWWYPIDDEPFTLVECGRRDCDVVCKSFGPDGPVSDPLTEAEQNALCGEHSMRWEIEYYAHFMRKTVLDELRKRSQAGALSMQNYLTCAAGIEQITAASRALIAAHDASKDGAK